jgi:hypothetical protein
LKDKEQDVLSNKLIEQSMAQSLSNKVINVTTLQAKQEIKKCDVTYIVSVLGLGLASQEVDVFDKSTNELAQTSMAMKR